VADCFIKLDGINGESSDLEFKDHIQVESWGWSIRQHVDANWDRASTRRAEVSNLVFSHQVDLASPALWSRCARNDVLPSASLVMRRAGGTAQKYLFVKLKNVRVLGVSMNHDASNVIPLERVELACEHVEYEYAPQSARGSDRSGRSTFSMNLRVG
jgi:type VI secretion system secreted protein Hcp